MFKGLRFFKGLQLGIVQPEASGSGWLGVLQCLETLRVMRVWGLGLYRDYGVSVFRLMVVLQGLGSFRFWGSSGFWVLGLSRV